MRRISKLVAIVGLLTLPLVGGFATPASASCADIIVPSGGRSGCEVSSGERTISGASGHECLTVKDVKAGVSPSGTPYAEAGEVNFYGVSPCL